MKPAYIARKALFATTNVEPSLADQAGADETNINRIVKSMGIHGQTPITNKSPMYGDFTNSPEDLREAIEVAQSLHKHWQELPQELKDLNPEDLYNLTPADIIAKLKKPEPPKEPEPPKDEPKT